MALKPREQAELTARSADRPPAADRGLRIGRVFAAAVGALILAPVLASAGEPRIRFVGEAERTVVEVRGLDPALVEKLRALPPDDAQWPALLAVYTREADLAGGRLPNLLGAYAAAGRRVRFVPRFPLLAGETYVARWRPEPPGEARAAIYTVPATRLEPTTEVTAAYPSADLLPENLLRLYLQFSAPMSRGRTGAHIRLLDEAGSVVEAPFVAPERELWSPDRTRLTLFFDPGRIKRGVGPHTEVGPPLKRGRSYTLVVDRALTDARGVPLAAGYAKSFRVGAADREQPRAADWILQAPASPRGPLTLRFPEPLDRGLLDGLLRLLDDEGAAVPGRISIPAGEREWRFLPDQGWSEGVYRIRVETGLEDVAGNSLRRPFEVTLDGSTEVPAPRFLDLVFRLRR